MMPPETSANYLIQNISPKLFFSKKIAFLQNSGNKHEKQSNLAKPFEMKSRNPFRKVRLPIFRLTY